MLEALLRRLAREVANTGYAAELETVHAQQTLLIDYNMRGLNML